MDEAEGGAAAVPEAPKGDPKVEPRATETAAAGSPPAAAAGGQSNGAGSTPEGVAPGLNVPGISLLYDVELDATLQFGSKEMLLREVLELGPGDVVELDRHIAEPVDLVVGDRIVARGEVVVVSGNFGLRIIEVATPQMRLESIRCLF
jgi:flagellar motor switch protein FliN/FliY